MRIKITFLLVVCYSIACSQKQKDNYSDLYLDSIFAESKGTFVLFNLNYDSYKNYSSY